MKRVFAVLLIMAVLVAGSGLCPVMAQSNNVILVVSGRVSGTADWKDLTVTVTNQTRSLSRTTQLAEDAPVYLATFVSLNDSPIVSSGDLLQVTVKDDQQVIRAIETHTLNQAEVKAAQVTVNLELKQATVQPVSGNNVVLVVSGRVTDAKGARVQEGLPVTITNQNKKKT